LLERTRDRLLHLAALWGAEIQFSAAAGAENFFDDVCLIARAVELSHDKSIEGGEIHRRMHERRNE
jgi:hypothetical protein